MASINDNDEHEWLVASEFAKDKYGYEGETNIGDPSNWINLWVGGEYNKQTGKWGWSSGQELKGMDLKMGDNDPVIRTPRGTDSFDPSVRSKCWLILIIITSKISTPGMEGEKVHIKR